MLDFLVWRDIAASFTQAWFVQVPREVAKARLAKGDLEAGIVQTRERRAEKNDLVGGELVGERVERVDTSRYTEDQEWAAAVEK